jgi:hypothetical protein
LIAACKSFASVGKVMFLGCTVVSTVTRAKSFVRSADAEFSGHFNQRHLRVDFVGLVREP